MGRADAIGYAAVLMFWLELESRDPHYVIKMSREQVAITRRHIQETMQRVRSGAQSRRSRAVRHLSPPDREYMALLEWLESDRAEIPPPHFQNIAGWAMKPKTTRNPAEQIALLQLRIANYAKSLLGNPPDRESIEAVKQAAEKELAQLLEQPHQPDGPADAAG